eukprot:15040702-Alexandrium_andersonii.AAC.1
MLKKALHIDVQNCLLAVVNSASNWLRWAFDNCERAADDVRAPPLGQSVSKRQLFRFGVELEFNVAVR